MDNIYLVSFVISIIYLISKFLEMRFVTKENIALKTLVINTLIVYFSVIIGYFLIDQFNLKTKTLVEAPVFTDGPGF